MPIPADSGTQVTLYYVNGQTEIFSVPVTPQEFYQQLNRTERGGWIAMHLVDQTVAIAIDQIVKIEVKPPFPELAGNGLFTDAKRVTALTRGAAR